MDNIESNSEFVSYKRRRAGFKAVVTKSLNNLETASLQDDFTWDKFLCRKEYLDTYMSKVEDVDSQILELLSKMDIEDEDSSNIIDDMVDYKIKVTDRITELATIFKNKNKVENPPRQVKTSTLRLPELKCQLFSGKTTDKFEFKNFLQQFFNCVDSCGDVSNATKLSYLRSFLTDQAFKLISHLSISDENFHLAIDLLKAEYLDIEWIIDESFKQLINLYPKSSSDNFDNLRIYISEFKAILLDLQSYNVDLLECNTPGNKLIGHMLFSRLPINFKRELIHRVDSNYPSVNDIIDNYNEILKTLSRTTYAAKSNFNYTNQKPSKKFYSDIKVQNQAKQSHTSLENFNINFKKNTSPNFSNWCKFCAISSHSMVSCPTYSTFESRMNRCQELGLCVQCTSQKHSKEECPGRDGSLTYPCVKCNSSNHISAMCRRFSKSNKVSSNLCLNMQNSYSQLQPYLLPTISLCFSRGGRTVKIRCLCDTGSQRSYINKGVLDQLGLDTDCWTKLSYDITTFLGSKKSEFRECAMDVCIPGSKSLTIPMLVDTDFKIDIHVMHLNQALNNIVSNGYCLADPSLLGLEDTIPLQGLVGVDIIQFLGKMQLTSCMFGSAWELPDGIIPFGNIHHFFTPKNIPQLSDNCNNQRLSNLTGMSCKPVHMSHIYFVLEPKKTFDSPLDHVFSESTVEQGLENMFKIDSAGCVDIEASQLDIIKVKEFNSGIQFKNNHYHVALPWYDNLIHQVPSNHNVALAVLQRVVNQLSKKNLLSAYQNVFQEQLANGIIEKINIKPDDFDKHIWIPHRPVIKEEPNCTSKIRPVFNASLKTCNKPSLNEAAYAGVNLMTDLTKLMIYFRSNNYIMLSDIKQAFLQIYLDSEMDKNRFSFFMVQDNQLMAYRYKTIIFGFNASPFILNYVIKHHAGLYPDDECTKVLKSNFYVDNLIMTGNSPNKLQVLYNTAFQRMKEGGFQLRSWNSNHAEIRDKFREDDTFVNHFNEYEKVLGYKYLFLSDELQLAPNILSSEATTKRSILSQLSKIFDPLGLFLPLTIRGKLLMRELWSKKLAWDEALSSEDQDSWDRLYPELNQLFSLSVPRSCINEDQSNSLYVFCDASKSCYGFSVYNVSNGQSNLVFAKSKVSPIKPRSLPTLELMASHLALKCLPIVFDSFHNIQFQEVFLLVDSQVVLTWLLSEMVKTKNILARNRISDISLFKKNLQEKYNISVSFKYVSTESNPADLLTRGLKLSEFMKFRVFWYQGPEWLRYVPVQVPLGNLGCLSEENKKLVCDTYQINTSNSCDAAQGPILTIESYSSLSKLLSVTKYIFKAIFHFRKVDNDPLEAAKLYWIKYMQAAEFQNELNYLKYPSKEKVPLLVNQLNLFVDDFGIIRSRGRIGKTLHYDFEVVNPILLAKDHSLTHLIVQWHHNKCKHLGVQSTMTSLRLGGFWIPRMRQAIKKMLYHCAVCKKFNSLSFGYPKMTNLPKHRVNFIKPFCHTGVDYTGHIWVQGANGSQKMYLLIFTCLNVRAVHIEIVPDLSTQQFILSFSRFVNRYGTPTHLYSDNAKTFIAGGRILAEALISDEFSSRFQSYSIKHIRIPAFSPWWGSCWERLIKTIKLTLYKVVGRATLSYFELLTVIADVQSAINSRPLTYRSSDDDLEIISPDSFLKFNSNPSLLLQHPDNNSLWENDPPSRDSLLQMLNIRDETFKNFKDLWYENYLLSLRENYRDLHQDNWNNRIKAGDVVLIKLPNKPRPYWLLGRVMELIIGFDHIVRSVKVKRGDGSVTHHSINHLYPLELSLTHNFNDQTITGETQSLSKDNVGSECVINDISSTSAKAINQTVNQSNIPSDQASNLPQSNNQSSLDYQGEESSAPKRAAAKACRKRMRTWCQRLR